MSKIDQYGYPKGLIDHEKVSKEVDKKLPSIIEEYTSDLTPEQREKVLVETSKIYDIFSKIGGKYWQDTLREEIKELKELVLKKETGRPIGTDEKTIKRYSKIRAKYNSMLIKGFTPKHIRKTLAKEENLEESTIKGIYYSQKL